MLPTYLLLSLALAQDPAPEAVDTEPLGAVASPEPEPGIPATHRTADEDDEETLLPWGKRLSYHESLGYLFVVFAGLGSGLGGFFGMMRGKIQPPAIVTKIRRLARGEDGQPLTTPTGKPLEEDVSLAEVLEQRFAAMEKRLGALAEQQAKQQTAIAGLTTSTTQALVETADTQQKVSEMLERHVLWLEWARTSREAS
jgi:uncharacterized coiled-coil protein SlyX